MRPIGLIIGHGYCKAVSGARTTRFPAVAAPASDTGYESAVGRGPTAVNLNGQGDWLIGEEALTFAPQRLVSILDRTRYHDPSFVALARYAIHQVVAGSGALSVMTGMPGAWFADKQARSALTQAIGKAGAPWGEVHVTVAPEAAGVFYAYVFESGVLNAARAQGTVGVIDAGYRDVNVCYFAGGRYVAGESVPGGMVDALRQIKRLIAEAYGVELALHEVDAVVRAGTLRVGGQLRPLPEGSSAALTKGLNTILAAGRSLWPNGGKTLDAVVLGGGGAVPLGTHLWAAFPQQFVVPFAGDVRGIPDDQIGRRIAAADPQLAGARGFAAAAQAALASGVAR